MPDDLHPTAESLAELLNYEDAAFIDCAYKTLLRRPPDSTGFHNYLRLLRSGVSKMRLLTRMRLSPEGRRSAQRLPGLKRAILGYFLADSPVTGWWYRPIFKAEADTPSERRIRAIQSVVSRIAEEQEATARDAGPIADNVVKLLGSLAKFRSP